jgi:isoquinoline 1-oxidoreductase alpha subunit
MLREFERSSVRSYYNFNLSALQSLFSQFLLNNCGQVRKFLPHNISLMARFQIIVNNQIHNIDADPRMPLLWVIREILGLTGTKYGCGIAQCGACTVHLNGNPVRSCSIPIAAAHNQRILTIEGLSTNNSHPVQQAWIMEQVPQCGYCQSGQIMAAAHLLSRNANPNDADIERAMQGHICRCGTYNRIRQAIKTAARLMQQQTTAK